MEHSTRLAHISEDGTRTQTVYDHLAGTARLAGSFAAPFGAQSEAEFAAWLHDVGKYSDAFQLRLKGGPKVDHSTAGAQEAWVRHHPHAAFAVAGHHSGLPDGGSPADDPGDATLFGRSKKPVASYDGWQEVTLPASTPPAWACADPLSLAFFTRMLYSCLVDADPLTIKKFTTDIEDATPLGRLFDMDVIRPDGLKVDREELNLEGRRCLICGGPAKVCSSRRIHTVAELQEKTTEILTEARDAQDIADAARLAVRALLYEVTTTPKPGLVDRRNSGSHKDMDVFTFMDSAAALYPYFEACARTGCETAEQPAPETFAALRPLGCEAEGEMLDATGGVNTHKGAVFSVGIVCAALGRLDRSLWADAARVLAEVSAMTAGLTEKDFAGVTAENAATVGQKLYIQYGITGVRGQVEAGLPTVLNVGLPVLEEGLAKGYDFDRAGGGALLAILANSTDTNIIARSSRERQLALTEELKALLAQTPYPDKDALAALDDRFIAENLSPGGSADLLALTWLLHFVTTEGNIDE